MNKTDLYDYASSLKDIANTTIAKINSAQSNISTAANTNYIATSTTTGTYIGTGSNSATWTTISPATTYPVGGWSPNYPPTVKGKEILFSIDMEEIEEKLDRMDVDDLLIFLQHIERLIVLVQEKTIDKV